MSIFPAYERSSEKFELKNVYVGTHALLSDPAKEIVVIFVATARPDKNVAKRMLLQLHTLAGLPRKALITKLAALEVEATRQMFKDNFTAFGTLGVEYLPDATVEFYRNHPLQSQEPVAEDQVAIYVL